MNRHAPYANLRPIGLVIPALNEERSIGRVLEALPAGMIDQTVVVDNGSTDRTADVARDHGATVVHQPRRGYGAACLAGIAALDRPGCIVFLDADFSDDPAELPRLLQPIARGEAELVIGSRVRGGAQRGSLTVPQRFGSGLACALLGMIWGVRQTDLGPFRAITADALRQLRMDDPGYGWTVQMQARAARLGVASAEVPVSYRPRIGTSKISGTLRGVAGAGTKILATIGREAMAGLWRGDGRPPKRKLLVFTRYPEPGKTKTRLIPALGERGAANLQRRMTHHVLGWADALCEQLPTGVEVRYAGGDRQKMRAVFGGRYRYRAQGAGDLGEKLNRAFAHGFADGASRVIAIGTDCPQLTDATLAEAFAQLDRVDVVIGPASDGGYYLIGLSAHRPELFRAIDWGSERVFKQTRCAAQHHRLSVAPLATLDDVDRAEDLTVWEAASRQLALPGQRRRVTVIVPARNEEELIGPTLQRSREAGEAELIVAVGDSTDGTARIAERHGATVVRGSPGRAAQMNAGASAATGDVLLFCHADTLLPGGYDRLANRALSEPGVAAGAFELGIGGGERRLRWVERLVNFRSRARSMPYGDQAVFLRRATFERLGGYKRLPVMEDYELIRRLRRAGQVRVMPHRVETSPRYWQNRGVVRTTLINRLVVIGYHLGLPVRALAWLRLGRAGSIP